MHRENDSRSKEAVLSRGEPIPLDVLAEAERLGLTRKDWPANPGSQIMKEINYMASTKKTFTTHKGIAAFRTEPADYRQY